MAATELQHHSPNEDDNHDGQENSRSEAGGSFVSIDSTDHYRIDDVDRLEPFLTTVVSSSDLWLFASSTGALTAGRVDARNAVFPYLPDDMIHREAGEIGPVTAFARNEDGVRELWRPFSATVAPGCRRSIAKSVLGDRLVFEESNAEWQLRIRATWAPSRTFGWVRRVEVTNLGPAQTVEVLDGLVDVMPPGVDPGVEQGSSNLVNAFRRAEMAAAPNQLATFHLESLITDRAEPGEALSTNVVWSHGLDVAADLDPRAIPSFLSGSRREASTLVTGRPGAYLLRSTIDLPAFDTTTWIIVMDAGLDHLALSTTIDLISPPDIDARVSREVRTDSVRLRRLLTAADAMQTTSDRAADAHHLSNVLFNSMRGGVFPYGHDIPIAHFAQFVASRNRRVAERQSAWLATRRDDWLPVEELRSMAAATGDPDLQRLVLEYLPLTFSRRHGDPSRPWNHFSIQVADDDGTEILRYEGNWRDIFQNWEALLTSYPAYFSHVVAKFVNASTLDGFNPYRISSEGVDWEVPDPGDPWGNIGYWGDHQIVYLLRLVEGWQRFEPGALQEWLDQPVFVYADVPYRIADRADMIEDPRSTITFLDHRASAIEARETEIGSDGRLVTDASGDLLRVGLAEKLLVPVLSKMSNFVPGGGIWMNTQRPEWNDANNALAGPGVSMVTAFYLHRFIVFLCEQLDGQETIRLSSPTAAWLDELTQVYADLPPAPEDPHLRRRMIEALGVAADAQTRRALAGARPELLDEDVSRLLLFLDLALQHLSATIVGSRRSDGLVDSYNLLSFPDNVTAGIERLGPMLEGQVAALASGVVTAEESLGLLDALFESDIFRSDLGTFMLYPPKSLPTFADRNVVPAGALAAAEIERLPSVVAIDSHNRLRFRSEAVNASALEALLDLDDAEPSDRSAAHRAYEATFGHAAYTGRSGSMHGYEGIGSTYWHMVSKLLLATQERYWDALDNSASSPVVAQLASAYGRIRDGLGFTKTAAEFGAFPIDCYSHTPAHSGAQQPGMTGQVKEAVLARFGELGIRITDGQIRLEPGLLPDSDLFGPDGTGIAAFTLCSVPMSIRRGDVDQVVSVRQGQEQTTESGTVLSRELSAAVFARNGDVSAVHWTVAR